MIKYARIPFKNANGDEGYRYTKNGLMTKESRIPHDVMEKFEYAPAIEYDDMPEARRCIACDAPQSRTRYLNAESIELCEYHYQNMRLGQIAQQVRELKEEQEKKVEQDSLKRGKAKRKPKRKNRTELAQYYAG